MECCAVKLLDRRVVIVGAEHGTRAGYYGYYGYYGYGYGYAHPGETSILKRFLPWKGTRKPESRPNAPAAPAPSPVASNGSPGVRTPAPPRPSVPADTDDPWV